MGGAGVASVLAEESAFLNPASMAFFNSSNFYVQKDSATLSDAGVVQPKPKSLGLVLSDGNPSLSGSLSYVIQEEGDTKRKRWGTSFSAPAGERSTFGVSLRQSADENINTKIVKKYYQTVLGVTHALDEKFTLGIVAYDPFKSKGNETKALLGMQYVLMNYLTAAIDFGADYTSEEISKTLLYKAALQVKVLDDFYLRFGGFNDKARSEKGNGFGLAWIQPRLSFEFAVKSTKRAADINIHQTDANLKETSFAASIRF